MRYLDESDVGGFLTETLTADVETVLADQTGLVSADTAIVTLPSAPFSRHHQRSIIERVPLPTSLSVGAGTRVPNGVVGHICRFEDL